MTLRFEKQWRGQFVKPISRVRLTSGPEIMTLAASSISTTTATGNGNIIFLGDVTPTQYGMCWGTTPFPTTADNKSEEGAATQIGVFTSNIIGLATSTIYYIRAYITSIYGTSYGEQFAFTTEMGFFLKEDGDFFLKEDGDKLILE